ncbi:MAG: single-stranded DNA-binding protein [Candidatus Thalassarchaeaceae archaeon]
MLSKATIIGNVGKDPEVRNTNSGKQVASFSVASETGYGNKKETQWHNVVTFDERLIDNVIRKYVTKGTKVFATGDLVYRSWDKQDGTKGYKTEIILGFGSEFKLLSSDKKSDTGSSYKPEYDEDLDDEIAL